MKIEQNSRIITHPSIVDVSSNHTVVLIDASDFDIENISIFCSISDKNFDIYLYYHDLSDFEWLTTISERASCVLLSETSKVDLPNCDKLVRFGEHQQLTTPLKYFENQENLETDGL